MVGTDAMSAVSAERIKLLLWGRTKSDAARPCNSVGSYTSRFIKWIEKRIFL